MKMMVNPLALKRVLDYFETLKIDSHRCVKNKSSLASCNLCYNVCPTKGLNYVDGKWEVSECTLCGRCINLCPMEVFSLDEDKLLANAKDKEVLCLGCHQDKNTLLPIKINCFKQLTPELVLLLLSKTKKIVLLVDEEVCGQCQNDWSKEVLVLLLQRFHLITEGRLVFETRRESINSFIAEYDASRRDYLKKTYRNFLNQGSKVVEGELKNKNLAIKEEEKLLKRIHLFKAYKDNYIKEASLPYPLLEVRHCHFCGACTTLCPTQALKIVETTKDDIVNKHLLFHPTLCTQCKLCEDICMSKGIFWGDFIRQELFFLGKWLEVARGEKKICQGCKQDFFDYEDETMCYFCRKRDNYKS